MAVLDAGPFQAWMAAWDKVQRARSQLGAAKATENANLIHYVEASLQKAIAEYNAALAALKDA